jgi:hypothetical protein
VTAILRTLLLNELKRPEVTYSLGGEPTVTVLPPDPESPNSGAQDLDRLNLFLFQTTPNLGWRNVDLPSFNSRGDRTSNPPLAIDLHYLLTAYSKQSLHAEIMLGYAMRLLHETPVLPRDKIRSVLNNLAQAAGATALERVLVRSQLAEQVEQIKITPQPLNTEEMSKLWSAIQTQYRPTVAYHVSVVLIDSQYSTKSALPVLERNIDVAPFRQPVIETVQSAEGANQPIELGSTIVIRGQRLQAEQVRMRLGAAETVLPRASVTDTEINLPLAAPALPDADTVLRAGVQPVQVIHDLILGTPGDPHRGFESNVAAMVLRPLIVRRADRTYQIDPATPQRDDQGDLPLLEIRLSPIVGSNQRVILLLNELSRDRAFSIPATRRDSDTVVITFQLPNTLPAGTYLLRVQVDGAESRLEFDPSANQFTAPTLTIPPP